MKTWISRDNRDKKKSWSYILIIALLLIGCLKASSGGFLFGYRTLLVYSGSMEPAIPVGSVLVEEKVEAGDSLLEEKPLQVGDVVTFRWPSGDADSDSHQITHRIMRIIASSKDDPCILQTKGDNNPTEDPFQLTAEDIEGRVLLVFPYTIELGAILLFIFLYRRVLARK